MTTATVAMPEDGTQVKVEPQINSNTTEEQQ
jgi:hypothetical protein